MINVELTQEEAEELIEATIKHNDQTGGRAAARGSALASAWNKLAHALKERGDAA